MYRKPDTRQLSFKDFILPFGGHLDGDNRWVQLSQIIPWQQFETQYADLFPSLTGNPARPFRMALGALLIKERMNISDRETVLQIQENPYLQFFIGIERFEKDPPFDASMMTHFRKRITNDMLQEINEQITRAYMTREPGDDDHGGHDHDASCEEAPDTQESESNRGKLLLDATCTPADITFPTDLGLVNKAREKTESIIDVLFEPIQGTMKKPRNYRNRARKEFLVVSKMRRKSKKLIRKTLRRQLGYVERNLKSIERLITQDGVSLSLLTRKQYRDLLVVSEVIRQQRLMFDTRTHQVSGRIVSISQPHVRPIVRGKAHANVEFGAKVTISVVDGFLYQEKISWDAYHEGKDLIEQVQAYHGRFGYYPEAVLADKIYQNRENRKFCSSHGIRLSGPPLGRPPKDRDRYAEQKRQQRQDEIDRIPVEGKFGNAKRRYSLDRIMAKRQDTSETTIALVFLLMNLEKIRATGLFVLTWILVVIVGLRRWITQRRSMPPQSVLIGV